MISTTNSFFDTTISFPASALTAAPKSSARSSRKRRAVAGSPVAASLWRQTINESASEGSYLRFVNGVVAGLTALCLGSVGYAIWQLWSLMAGNHLQDAITAFSR